MTTLTMRGKWEKNKPENDSVNDDSICEWDDSDDECSVDDHNNHNEDIPYTLALRRGYKEQIEEMPKGVPVEIIPNKLWIGDSDCVREEFKDELRSRNITAVLNMAGNPGTPADPAKLAGEWKQQIQVHSFRYKAIAADDIKTYPLLENHWTEAQQFLKQVIVTEKRACLVHCVAGQNRSGLIVCAYYMLSQRINVLETVEFVRSRRGTEVLKNPGFQRQLVQLAKAKKLLGPKPMIST